MAFRAALQRFVDLVALSCVLANPVWTPAVCAEVAVDAPAAPHPQSKRGHVSRLERHAQRLANTLNLDPAQRVALRKVLETEQERLAGIWSDSSLPGAYRVSATRAVSRQTTDEIRNLLNEEQRKKYILVRQREAPVGAAGDSVETWMSRGKPQ